MNFSSFTYQTQCGVEIDRTDTDDDQQHPENDDAIGHSFRIRSKENDHHRRHQEEEYIRHLKKNLLHVSFSKQLISETLEGIEQTSLVKIHTIKQIKQNGACMDKQRE